MRYFIQVAVMLGDLMLIGASAIGLYLCYNNFPANVILVILILRCYKVWQEEGGFIAWNPKMIKKFMENSKMAGL